MPSSLPLEKESLTGAQKLHLAARLARAYLSLWPAHPPAYYTAPATLGRAREEYADELQGGFLKWFDKRIDMRGKRVLDLGAGYGGRTVRYKELGAKHVVGLEISLPPTEEGSQFAQSRSADVSFLVGIGELLPFTDNSFDIICSYDVFEHVEKLEPVLAECRRVLAPRGTLYAVFPPFYHPTSSHFDGFVSKMPYANLLFRPKTLMQAAEFVLSERADGYRPSPLRPTDRLWTLNGVTIHSWRRMVKASRFSQKKIVCAPLFSPMNSKWKEWKMRYYAFFFHPLRWIPLLNECFVHRLVCELTK